MSTIEVTRSNINLIITEQIESIKIGNNDLCENHNDLLWISFVPEFVSKSYCFYKQFGNVIKNMWERLIIFACQSNFDKSIQQYTISGQIPQERLRRIYEIVNRLGYPDNNPSRTKPNWDKELEYILEGGGELLPTTVVSDIYVEKDDVKYAFELKAPMLNSDQTKVSKEKILKLYSMVEKPITGAFYVLPYNPYGKRENYNWSFPARWFDMKNDKVVLIGNEFWDFIGGKGTYQLFIDEINKLGIEYKERIYKEYLGIDNQNLNGFELQ